MRRILAAAIALCAYAGPSLAQVSTLPANPRYQETVRIQVPQVFNDAASVNQAQYNTVDSRATTVSMSANRITVTLVMARSDIQNVPSASVDFPLGQFPVGTYDVLVTRREPSGAPFGDVGATAFTVAARAQADPLWNHTDIWWDPRESGWGLNMVQHGSGKIFATWFVYDATNKATWFSVSDGIWTSATEYRGAVYRSTGPDYAECTVVACPRPFDPSLVTRTAVGDIVIAFHPDKDGVAAALITIDGKSVLKSLQRLSF